jgi:hypothetical protein
MASPKAKPKPSPKAKPTQAPPPQRAAATAELVVALRPVESLKPYPGNPRTISDEAVAKLAAVIQRYGWRKAIVVNEAGVILAGHTTLMAAKHLGLTKVPVHVAAGLSQQEQAAYRLADNRTADETRWDRDLLKIELADLPASLPTGFDPDELASLLGDIDEPAGPPPEDPSAWATVRVQIPAAKFDQISALVDRIADVPEAVVQVRRSRRGA